MKNKLVESVAIVLAGIGVGGASMAEYCDPNEAFPAISDTAKVNAPDAGVTCFNPLGKTEAERQCKGES